MPQVSISLLATEIEAVNEELEREKMKNPRATFSNLSASLLMQGLNERLRQREKSAKKSKVKSGE
jgi:hypothetical protein